MTALRAENLTKRFGDIEALKGLDLKVEAGEIVCLLGANGAGKTTTINLFLGFIEPTSGAATVDGVNVQSAPIEARVDGHEEPENLVSNCCQRDRGPAVARDCYGRDVSGEPCSASAIPGAGDDEG